MPMAGRPPKSDDERRDAPPLRIRLTADERALLDQAAGKAMDGETVPGAGVTSTWARNLLLRAAKRLLKIGQ